MGCSVLCIWLCPGGRWREESELLRREEQLGFREDEEGEPGGVGSWSGCTVPDELVVARGADNFPGQVGIGEDDVWEDVVGVRVALRGVGLVDGAGGEGEAGAEDVEGLRGAEGEGVGGVRDGLCGGGRGGGGR